MSIFSENGCILSKNDAEKIISEYDNMSDFGNQVFLWAEHNVPAEDYNNAICGRLRDEIVKTFDDNIAKGNLYKVDLEVGLKLYELLDPEESNEYGFSLIDANDDDFWRYLSVKVMPDLTFIRYPNRAEDYNFLLKKISGLKYSGAKISESDSDKIRKKRFYSHTRRIWLKTLWWYIYLSWQGNIGETRDVLQNNGSDNIGHLIERPGRGYRVELFRTLMKKFSSVEKRRNEKFRAATKLNLAKCLLIEPELTDGGDARYAEILFDEIENTKVEATDLDQ